MPVDVSIIRNLTFDLSSFMVDEAKIGLMPRGIEGGEVSFSNPIVTSIQVGGAWRSATMWKDCGVEPIVGLTQSCDGCNVEIDRGTDRSEVWNDLRKTLSGMIKDAGSMPRNSLTKRAREENRVAADAEAKAARIQSDIDAAKQVSRAIANSSEEMNWRAAKFCVETAATDVAGSLNKVASQRKNAAEGFVRSGMYYLMAGAAAPAVEALYRASGLFALLDRHVEAAVWAEAAWQMDRKSHEEWASTAVVWWLFALRGSSSKAFELSHALRVAWSAQNWEHYSNAIKCLINLHEERGDYAKAAAGYLRSAWALLQKENLDGAVSQRMVVSSLEDASLAWELAERDKFVKKTSALADKAKKIVI